MSKYIGCLMLVFALSAGCKKGTAGRAGDMYTLRHDGMCFVVYDDNSTGVAMVRVDCADVKEGGHHD